MRKIILILLLAVLAALIAARSALPDPAIPVLAGGAAGERHILELSFPGGEETAGSGMVGEISAYYTSRAATETHALTGALRGKSVLLICADEWAPDPENRAGNPALYRLARESARIEQVWRPDWYQGDEGRLFALLSGLAPTRTDDRSSLVYTGEREPLLPFALPRSLAREGYARRAFILQESCRRGLEALGFGDVQVSGKSAEELADDILAALDGGGPVFVFAQWSGDGEAALAKLMEGLAESGHRTDTALCLLTGDADAERAQLYLWGAGLSGAESAGPCSELDIPPTLLNLVGAAFDARLVAGRDIFAPERGDAPTPVALYGSAFTDWVTDAGLYRAAADEFTPFGDDLPAGERGAYIRQACLACFRQYVFSRRALECDYFRLLFPARE